MTKGQAPFISHTLMILIGIFIIVSVSTLVTAFYLTALRNEIREGLRQMSVQTSDNIVRLYETSKSSGASPKNYTSILLGEVDLSLPDSVSKRNYEMSLVSPSQLWTQIQVFTSEGQNLTAITDTSGAKIMAQTTQIPKVKVEYDIPNIGINVFGKIENGKDDKLRYYRYNLNGTVYDAIVLGKADLLLTLTNVS